VLTVILWEEISSVDDFGFSGPDPGGRWGFSERGQLPMDGGYDEKNVVSTISTEELIAAAMAFEV